MHSQPPPLLDLPPRSVWQPLRSPTMQQRLAAQRSAAPASSSARAAAARRCRPAAAAARRPTVCSAGGSELKLFSPSKVLLSESSLRWSKTTAEASLPASSQTCLPAVDGPGRGRHAASCLLCERVSRSPCGIRKFSWSEKQHIQLPASPDACCVRFVSPQINVFLRIVRRREDGYHDLVRILYICVACCFCRLDSDSLGCCLTATWLAAWHSPKHLSVPSGLAFS